MLKAANLTKEIALLNFGLAPLDSRRDVAMLGLIHRTVLGLGPTHFKKFFVLAEASRNPDGRICMRGHNWQLQSYRVGRFLDAIAHLLLEAIVYYNLLLEYIVAA